VNGWDQWLQQFMSRSQEAIGQDWLNVYLTSPLWRFAISAGVIDNSVWCGVLMPSVDRVGRYFPLTIATKLPAECNPFDFISSYSSWYDGIEQLALSALHGHLAIDELAERISAMELTIEAAYSRSKRTPAAKMLQMEKEFEEQLPMSVYGQLLDYLMLEAHSSYSVWSTDGSEHVAPTVFATQHLPAMDKMPAMLDGRWQQWGAHQPYTLKNGSDSER
jgi:type VI secretion system protein ImpM